MKRRAFTWVFSLLFVTACFSAPDVHRGPWRGTFFLNDSTLMPFRFEVSDSGFVFVNAAERIATRDISMPGDSVFVTMPVFDSEFRLKISGDTLRGVFVNHQRVSNQLIRCEAVYGSWNRMADDFELKDFSGRWSAVFEGDDPPLNVAVAEFIQSGNKVTGTFLTPTGDYRFLDGFHTDGRSMELSAFDGSHVFYFTASFDDYDTLRGHYYSGTHWHDTWKAWRNKDATLPDADSLSFLKEGFTGISFTFPDADSQLVSLGDARFKGKVVLVQIMGSWCPNCMDEAIVLAPFYDQYRSRGLEIIGLDFERIPSFSAASGFIKKFQKHFSINYPILFAGTNDRKLRAQAIPQLRDIVGFPTLIYIDRKGVVRKIHTGFSGPATGIHFEKWKDDFYRFVDLLLKEK